MKIDDEEARRIAVGAQHHFDDASLERLAAEMTEILGYVDQLRDVELSSAAERAPIDGTPLREDVPHPSLEQAIVARNAPAWSGGFFIVPRVIGTES